MRMRRPFIWLALLVHVTSGIVVVGTASPAAAYRGQPANLSIPHQDTAVTGSSVAARTGPHVTCGVVFRSNQGPIRTRCYVQGDGVTRNGVTWYTWSWVSHYGLPGAGWMSDAYLQYGGATRRC